MSNKQSSIEWLVSKILVEYESYINEEGDFIDKPINQFFNAYKDSVNLVEYVNKAKEMHKQEIIKAAARGYLVGENDISLEDAMLYGDDYYNKTFGE